MRSPTVRRLIEVSPLGVAMRAPRRKQIGVSMTSVPPLPSGVAKNVSPVKFCDPFNGLLAVHPARLGEPGTQVRPKTIWRRPVSERSPGNGVGHTAWRRSGGDRLFVSPSADCLSG